MKLADMPLKKSFEVEDALQPLIAVFMEDKDMLKGFESVYDKTPKGIAETRVRDNILNSKVLMDGFLRRHLKTTCDMLALLNDLTPEETKELEGMTRGELTTKVSEILQDGDLIAFFVSPKALAPVK